MMPSDHHERQEPNCPRTPAPRLAEARLPNAAGVPCAVLTCVASSRYRADEHDAPPSVADRPEAEPLVRLNLGEAFADWILELAGLLRHEAAPGWVSLALMAGLFAALISYSWRARGLLRTIAESRSVIGDTHTAFDDSRFIEISQSFKKWESVTRQTARHRLGEAWREFAETVNRQKGLFNTVRPREFFDRELLHMEHRFFAQLPALFVSVGLLLTFLGLVAALDQTRGILQETGVDTVSEGLRNLLQVAGAKFIMSLTGLFCSIVFGLWFRTREGKIDEALHGLCADIERGFEYRSADSFLLEKVLEVLEEQGTHLQTFSTELVAQVARPLREEIPQAMRDSIREAMGPALAKFEEGAGKGLDSLVAGVSKTMSGGVQDSARAISETMDRVGQTLNDVASRLDDSAVSMGGQMDHAVGALAGEILSLRTAMADSTEAARENLQDGAQGMRATMEEALQEIRKSTQAGADGIDKAATAMAAAVAGSTHAASENLQDGAQGMRATMEDALQEIRKSTQAGADGIDHAATAMTAAVDKLATRADEASKSAFAAGSRTIEEASLRAVEGLGASAEAVSQAMKGMAGDVRDRVGEASSAIGSDLLDQLKDLAAAIGELQTRITSSVGTVDRYAESLDSGTRTITRATAGLSSASTELTQAALPVRGAVSDLVEANRSMEQKVSTTAEAMESGVRLITQQTVATLRSTADAVRNSQAAAEETRRSLEQVTRKFQDLVERFGGLDHRLGEAWKKLEADARASLAEFRRFEEELNQEFARSLGKLQEVIEQAEPFTPRNGRY